MNQITENRPFIPEVTANRTAAVVTLSMGTHDAVILAKILAHYDVFTADVAPVEGYDAPVWHHTLLELLTANAKLLGAGQ